MDYNTAGRNMIDADPEVRLSVSVIPENAREMRNSLSESPMSMAESLQPTLTEWSRRS